MTFILVLTMLRFSFSTINLEQHDDEGYYLTDQEKIVFTNGQFALTSNNSDLNLTELLEIHQNQLLFESLRLNIDFPYQDVFLVETYDQKFIQICFIEFYKINCKFQISTYLLDDNLILEHENVTLFSNLTNIEQIMNFNESFYLLISQSNKSKIAQILQINSSQYYEINVQHQINIQSDDQNLLFCYFKKSILFYETNTYTSNVYYYQISNDNKFNYSQTFKISYEGNQAGKIKYIQFTSDLELAITYEYFETRLNILNPSNQFSYQPISFELLGKNQDLFYGIDASLSENSMDFRDCFLFFGSQHRIPMNAFILAGRVTLVYENEVMIFYSNQIYQSVKMDFTKVLKVGNLPFFAGQTKDNNIIFYQSKPLPNYFHRDNSKFVYILAPFRFNSQNYFFSKYDLKPYYFQSPQIIGNNKKPRPILMFDNIRILQRDSLFQGLPISMIKCTNPSLIFFNRSIKTSFQVKKQLIKILFDDQFIAVALNDSVIASYVFQKQEILFSKSFHNFTDNKIFTHLQYFIVVKRNQLFHYVFEDKDFILKNIINFNSDITQIKQNQAKLHLLLDNCTFLHYNIKQKATYSEQSTSINQIFFSNCTQLISSLGTYININSTSFSISLTQQYKRIYQFQKIIECDQINNLIIIYQLIDQKIIIQLYTVSKSYLIYLYDLPLYHYVIQFPLQKKFVKTFLAIHATFEQKDFFLIFNTVNQAFSSLIEIISIDKDQTLNFDFIESKNEDTLLYYIKNESIQFMHLNEIEVQVSLKSNKYVTLIQTQCSIQSQFFSYSKDINRSFIFVNNQFKILLMGEKYINYDKYSIKLDNLQGSINDIELQEKKLNCSIQKPVVIQTQDQICSYVQNQYCINQQKKLIYDFFSREQVLLYEIQHSYQVLRIYDNDTQMLLSNELLTIPDKEQQNDFTFSNVQSNAIDKSQCNNLFLFELKKGIVDETSLKFSIGYLENNQINELFLQGQNFFFRADIYYSQINYLISIANQYSYIIYFYIFTIKQQIFSQKKIGSQKREFSIDLLSHQHMIFDSNIQEIKIIDLKIEEEILTITLAVLFLKTQGYLISVKYNFINNYSEFQVKNVIRYGINNYLDQPLFIDKQLIILKQTKYSLKSKILFYDLHDSDQKEIIDFYYKITVRDIDSIQQYNQTHFMFLSKFLDNETEFFNVTLLEIGNYVLKCEKQIHQISITIKNDVEDTIILLKTNKNSYQYYIILTASLIIQIIILSKKQTKNQKNVPILNV